MPEGDIDVVDADNTLQGDRSLRSMGRLAARSQAVHACTCMTATSAPAGLQASCLGHMLRCLQCHMRFLAMALTAPLQSRLLPLLNAILF